MTMTPQELVPATAGGVLLFFATVTQSEPFLSMLLFLMMLTCIVVIVHILLSCRARSKRLQKLKSREMRRQNQQTKEE